MEKGREGQQASKSKHKAMSCSQPTIKAKDLLQVLWARNESEG